MISIFGVFYLTQEEVIENKNNKEFVLKALSDNGKFLELVSPELQNDKEVVMTALEQDPRKFRICKYDA